MDKPFVAHVKKQNDIWVEPHLLVDHLKGSAEIAQKFAEKFNSGHWAYLAALAHDLGKGRSDWQEYLGDKSGYGYDEEAHLEHKQGKMPHAVHGAKFIEELLGVVPGRFISYCIAGHHAGLPDLSSARQSGQSSLKYQLNNLKDYHSIAPSLLELFENLKPGMPPWRFTSQGLDLSLWIRMLYSCLVDADFLDTEAYMDKNRALSRKCYKSINELSVRYYEFMALLEGQAEVSDINRIRKEVRIKCLKAAQMPQGFFSLSVPTGGGKTLASLGFAFEHVKKHKLDRIIYVIPYTSIIEQNAAVIRSALGEDQVLEHHSALDEDDCSAGSRLAAENWDAPVIITTSVQFFESLFSAKPSRCRKLHNIVNSVVILDEAQLTPIKYLSPILEALVLLKEKYGVSFVFATATQPAFDKSNLKKSMIAELENVTEIVGNTQDVNGLYESLNRIQVKIPDRLDDISSWDNIAGQLANYKQVLCVVSDRKSCRELHNLMPPDTFHLSALMCGKHRSKVINEIKARLKAGQSVRVISTQLVEAGVDIDFPVVFRSLAGLDSLAQAAGRCNREGKLNEPGQVFVFNPPRKPPAGALRQAAEVAMTLLKNNTKDPLNHKLFYKYFSEFYWRSHSHDEKDICSMLEPGDDNEISIYFRTASNCFRIIDDTASKSIIVPYENEQMVKELKMLGLNRDLMRKMQQYVVNIYNHEFNLMFSQGAIEEVYPNVYILSSDINYCKKVGVLIDSAEIDTGSFIQ